MGCCHHCCHGVGPYWVAPTTYAPPAWQYPPAPGSYAPPREDYLRRLEDERDLLEQRLRRLERDLADLRAAGLPAESQG
jgi:hypothetical protein